MAAIIEMDTALWLHNKLGKSDNQWSTGGIASHFNRNVLRNVYDCFLQLDAKAKVKLLLSFLEIPLRNMTDFQDLLEDICDLADSDTDEWVKVASSIVKDYPVHQIVDKSLGKVASSFQETVEEIISEVEDSQSANIMKMLPLECVYLNRAVLNQMLPNPPAPIKHFTLRRKPKSAALRAKITQKASEAATQRRLSLSSSVPPGKASLKRANSSTSRLQTSVSHSKTALSKISALPKKTKLLDITEQPLGAREQKKRKKMMALEASMEEAKRKHAAEKEEKLRDEQEVEEVEKNPEAETETDNENEQNQEDEQSAPEKDDKLPPKKKDLNIKATETSEPTTPTPSYAMLPGSTPITLADNQDVSETPINPCESVSSKKMNAPPLGIPQSFATERMNQRSDRPSSLVNVDPTASYNTQHLQRELQMRIQHEHELRMQQHMFQRQHHLQQLQEQHQQKQVQYPHGANLPFGAPAMGLTHHLSQMNSSEAPPSRISGMHEAMPVSQQKKGLSLTREQMLAAQEMFRSANSVTRAEKALILGFMAGARDNPFPQQGSVITIKLSEDTEVQHNQDGPQKVFIEMLFEMNYDTGHWRRLKRTRVVS